MKLLIDTQILIWYQLYDPKLHANIYDFLTRLENTVYVSQISLVEIAIKQKIGKLPELDVSISTLASLIEQDGFIVLPLQTKHIEAYSMIPLFHEHRDPFCYWQRRLVKIFPSYRQTGTLGFISSMFGFSIILEFRAENFAGKTHGVNINHGLLATLNEPVLTLPVG